MAIGFIDSGAGIGEKGFWGKPAPAPVYPFNMKDADGVPIQVSTDQYVYANEETTIWASEGAESGSIPIVTVDPKFHQLSYAGQVSQVKLNNGHLIAVTFDSTKTTNYFWRSVDDGLTWTLLTTNNNSTAPYSLATDGIKVYAVGKVHPSTVRVIQFDPTTVPNPYNNVYVNVISGMTNLGYPSIAVDSSGVVHLAVDLIHPSYLSSLNLYYTKTTGGANTTWYPAQAVVNIYNQGGYGVTQPTMLMVNDVPTIFALQMAGTNGYDVRLFTHLGGAWNIMSIRSATNMTEPVAVVAPNNGIGMAWRESTSGVWMCKKAYNGAVTAPVFVQAPARNEGNVDITTDNASNFHVAFQGYDLGATVYDIFTTKLTNGVASNVTKYVLGGAQSKINPRFLRNYATTTYPYMMFRDANMNVVRFTKSIPSVPPLQTIPAITTATSESQLKVVANGNLKSSGTLSKLYSGFVANDPIGFTPL